MICYLCNTPIPDEEPFYNDYEKFVCKPCFAEAPRCFICRFPGKTMEDIAGLGKECEFCRGNLIAEGMDLEVVFAPLRSFIKPFGFRGDAEFEVAWTDRLALRELQTAADLPREEFIDDFLIYSYPIYYHGGSMHLLRRMTKPTLIAYGIVQLAAAELAVEYAQPDLAGDSEFHRFTRGWCHWIGYEAAQRLGYDLEHRQLRKWPELKMQGDFERWKSMTRFNTAAKMVTLFKSTAPVLARKHLEPGNPGPAT